MIDTSDIYVISLEELEDVINDLMAPISSRGEYERGVLHGMESAMEALIQHLAGEGIRELSKDAL